MPSFDDITELDEPPLCPLGNGYGVLLGTLGRLTWYRCAACGIDFRTDKREEHQ